MTADDRVRTLVMSLVFAMGGLLGVVVERVSQPEPPKPPEVTPGPTMSDLMDKISIFHNNKPVRFIMNPEGEIYILENTCEGSNLTVADIGRELQRVIDRNEANRPLPIFGRDN